MVSQTHAKLAMMGYIIPTALPTNMIDRVRQVRDIVFWVCALSGTCLDCAYNVCARLQVILSFIDDHARH